MFNVVIDYLPEDDEVEVVKQTTSGKPAPIEALFTGEDVLRFTTLSAKFDRKDLVRYAIRLAPASRPKQPTRQISSTMDQLGRRSACRTIPRVRRLKSAPSRPSHASSKTSKLSPTHATPSHPFNYAPKRKALPSRRSSAN
jgi:hypothetical protein